MNLYQILLKNDSLDCWCLHTHQFHQMIQWINAISDQPTWLYKEHLSLAAIHCLHHKLIVNYMIITNILRFKINLQQGLIQYSSSCSSWPHTSGSLQVLVLDLVPWLHVTEQLDQAVHWDQIEDICSYWPQHMPGAGHDLLLVWVSPLHPETQSFQFSHCDHSSSRC